MRTISILLAFALLGPGLASAAPKKPAKKAPLEEKYKGDPILGSWLYQSTTCTSGNVVSVDPDKAGDILSFSSTGEITLVNTQSGKNLTGPFKKSGSVLEYSLGKANCNECGLAIPYTLSYKVDGTTLIFTTETRQGGCKGSTMLRYTKQP